MKRGIEFGLGLFLVLVVCYAHFGRLGQMGLHIDDWNRLGWSMTASSDEVFQEFRAAWGVAGPSIHFKKEGRPVGDCLLLLLGALCGRTQWLGAAYILAASILSVNVLLTYSLLRRLADPPAALLGALCFALFPADGLRPNLTAAYVVQPALTLCLLAAHSYLSERKAIAYCFLAACLTIYETAFFPAFWFVLLGKEKGDLRKTISHWCILSLLLAVAFAGRSFFGEDRASHLGLEQIEYALNNLLMGPVAALKSFPIGVWDGYAYWSHFYGGVWLFLGLLLGLSWLVLLSRGGASPEVFPGWMIVAGFLMISSVYPPFLKESRLTYFGIDSRIHGPAALGASVFVCGLVTLVFKGRRFFLARSLLGGAACTAVSLGLFAHARAIQDDYVSNWAEQRTFWQEVLSRCPDLADGDRILVESPPFFYQRGVLGLSWDKAIVLRRVLQASRPPILYLLKPTWQDELVGRAPDRLPLARMVEFHPRFPPDVEAPAASLIFLKFVSGRLERLHEVALPEGEPIVLRPPSASGGLRVNWLGRELLSAGTKCHYTTTVEAQK